jgi:hypothetical protein
MIGDNMEQDANPDEGTKALGLGYLVIKTILYLVLIIISFIFYYTGVYLPRSTLGAYAPRVDEVYFAFKYYEIWWPLLLLSVLMVLDINQWIRSINYLGKSKYKYILTAFFVGFFLQFINWLAPKIFDLIATLLFR